jgi:hypothetical protein
MALRLYAGNFDEFGNDMVEISDKFRSEFLVQRDNGASTIIPVA